MADWKVKVNNVWDSIEIVSTNISEAVNHIPTVGSSFSLTAVIDVKDPELVNSFGVDAVIIKKNDKNEDELDRAIPAKLVKTEGTKLFFEVKERVEKAVSFRGCFRLFPTCDLLPNRMGFAYVRWF